MKTTTKTGKTGRWLVLLGLLSLLSLLTTGSTMAQDAKAKFDYGTLDLRVAVWVDRNEDEVYRKGQEMAVGFQSNEDAYAVVYRIDTDGEVTILWPRSRMDDGFVFGGHEYELPVNGARRLRVSSDEGEGYVEAVVSRYPFDLRHLELDFHHEPGATRVGFRVAGDPFLAMNEVNFALTGLEDAEDYIVTNYVAYYVHRQVEHPRYLCSQCHFEDDVAYHPYNDTCQLNITVDHHWGNTWWDRYGYYPVYTSPVYVYVDPWTWRPWVNFWYDPWWSTPYLYGVSWNYPIYSWRYSSYYRGGCYDVWGAGHYTYKPLKPQNGIRRKGREYAQVTPMVKSGRASGKAGVAGRTYVGEKANRRQRTAIETGLRVRDSGGLRIRGGTQTASTRALPGVRHTAGSTSKAPATRRAERTAGNREVVTPGQGSRTSRTIRTTDTGVRTPGQTPTSGSTTRSSGGSIRTVEPRNKGTRIWNLDRDGGTTSRQQRTQRVRPGTSERTGGATTNRGGTRVQPRTGGSSGRSGSEAVRGKTRTTNQGTRNNSKATVRGKSSTGKSRSSDQKSGSSRGSGSSSSSRSGGGKVSSGSSRSSGSDKATGSSGGSRSGGGGSSSRSSSSSNGGSRRR